MEIQVLESVDGRHRLEIASDGGWRVAQVKLFVRRLGCGEFENEGVCYLLVGLGAYSDGDTAFIIEVLTKAREIIRAWEENGVLLTPNTSSSETP